MSFTIYLTRHGQTILNKYRRFQGWCDAPLTDQGIEDAKKAGQRLKDVQFDFAYSSDSPRAIQTRDMIITENQFKAPETHELPNFREHLKALIPAIFGQWWAFRTGVKRIMRS